MPETSKGLSQVRPQLCLQGDRPEENMEPTNSISNENIRIGGKLFIGIWAHQAALLCYLSITHACYGPESVQQQKIFFQMRPLSCIKFFFIIHIPVGVVQIFRDRLVWFRLSSSLRFLLSFSAKVFYKPLTSSGGKQRLAAAEA